MPLNAVLRQFRDRDVLALEFQFLAHRTRGSKQGQLAHREIALLEGLDHLDADGTSRADYGHVRLFVHKYLLQRPKNVTNMPPKSNRLLS